MGYPARLLFLDPLLKGLLQRRLPSIHHFVPLLAANVVMGSGSRHLALHTFRLHSIYATFLRPAWQQIARRTARVHGFSYRGLSSPFLLPTAFFLRSSCIPARRAHPPLFLLPHPLPVNAIALAHRNVVHVLLEHLDISPQELAPWHHPRSNCFSFELVLLCSNYKLRTL